MTKRARPKTASRQEVEDVLAVVPELSMSDFIEVTPGRFRPTKSSMEKMTLLRPDLLERAQRMDEEEKALRIERDEKHAEVMRLQSEIAQHWFPVRLLRENHQWIDPKEQEYVEPDDDIFY